MTSLIDAKEALLSAVCIAPAALSADGLVGAVGLIRDADLGVLTLRIAFTREGAAIKPRRSIADASLPAVCIALAFWSEVEDAVGASP